MNEEVVQNGVMNENFVKNFVKNFVVMDLSIFYIGGWNSLQPINQKLLEEFMDENEPWLLIGIPSRDPFFVTQYLERHSVSSDQHKKKLIVDEMRVLKLFVFFVPTMFSGILGSLSRIQQVCISLFGLHANIVEEYVLLSALLHDQSRLQRSPCFQHQFVWLPFSRTLVCKGGQLFVLSCTWEHEIRVFEPELRCCVTLA